VYLVGIFNSISESKFELAQHCRLKEISIQKVKIPQENGGFFLPQKSYQNTVGEKILTG
jgi:hypothetical protein